MPKVKIDVLVYLTGISTYAAPPKILVGEQQFKLSHAHGGRLVLDGGPLPREEFNQRAEKIFRDVHEWRTHRVAVEVLDPVLESTLEDYPNLQKAQKVLKAKREEKKLAVSS